VKLAKSLNLNPIKVVAKRVRNLEFAAFPVISQAHVSV
jgi:hypothetical protein